MLPSAVHIVGPEALEEAEHLVCLVLRDSEVLGLPAAWRMNAS